MAQSQLSLRDLMTGAVPGSNGLDIPLGFQSDPQYNRFTYNIFSTLGNSRGENGVVPKGGIVPPISGMMSGSYGLQNPGQSPSTDQAGGVPNITSPVNNNPYLNNQDAPIGIQGPANYPIGVPGFAGGQGNFTNGTPGFKQWSLRNALTKPSSNAFAF